MAREVIWSTTALDDLESIAEYINKGSEYYAAAFVRNLWEAAQSLTTFSQRGQIVPELQDPTIRELLVRPYRLIYRTTTDSVFILAVIHGARRARQRLPHE